MSDTSSRNPTGAAQMLADALLRTVAGATATFEWRERVPVRTKASWGWWRLRSLRWWFRRW